MKRPSKLGKLLSPLPLLGLLLLLAGPAPAQVSNPSIISVTTAPSGACSAGLPNQQVASTGTQYSCQNVSGGMGTWGAIGGSGGSGTVTSVSVTSANGVSGTVATSTTTPAISLTLGAINPTSVGATTPGTGAFTTLAASQGASNFGTSGIFNVKTYGAICNGSAHPASGVYGSLAALQVVYSFATATTNELDWLGTQAAINAAQTNAASNDAGTVYTPTGTCIMSNSNSVTDGSGTLTFPEANDFPGSTAFVNWIGDGRGMSVVKWPSDLGSSHFAEVDSNRQTSTVGNTGTFSGLDIVGPGSSFVIGTSPANMSGLGIGSQKNLRDVYVSGFRAGIDYVGGQEKWENVKSVNNYYSVYASTANTGLFGDMVWERCIFANAMLAAVGVSQTASVQSLNSVKSYYGASPFSFYKETNSGAPTVPYTLQFATFTNDQFEFVGNGIFGDDRNSSSSQSAQLNNVNFLYPYFSWLSMYNYASVGQFAVMNVGEMIAVKIDHPFISTNWTPGSVGIINANTIQGLEITGDVQTLIANADAAASTADFVVAGGNPTVLLHNVGSNGLPWDGFYFPTQSFGTATAATIACAAENSFVATGVVAVPCSGSATDIPLGVFMQVDKATGGNGAILASNGIVTVSSSGTFSTSAPAYASTAATGKATSTASLSAATTPIIGALYGIPSTTTPTSVQVVLQSTSGTILPASVVTLTGTQTLTNKSISGSQINSGIVSGQEGGTGVNNSSRLLTYGANVTFAGAFTQTYTVAANSSVNVPSSGTLSNAIVATCGTTTTCANTIQNLPRIVWGTVTLSTGAATVSSFTAFTSTTSFACTASDNTSTITSAHAVPASSSSITVTGTGTDVVSYQCIGN